MMSPLSVAQFLPADQQLFDLVIFDEASQITVPDAIGAIARGRRSIVVGDPKQMPPTSFFERGAEDDAPTTRQGPGEHPRRGLAAAAAPPPDRALPQPAREPDRLLQPRLLRRRARHLPVARRPRQRAVRFRRVDWRLRARQGRGPTRSRRRRSSPNSVRACAIPRSRRQLDLGVVTFNAEQQRLIEDLLDQARREDPELEPFFGDDAPEPVFVKNLETVQGDERDVILFSIGYGPTEPGAQTMSMNFGPLNRKGGERRLNVAITRAHHRGGGLRELRRGDDRPHPHPSAAVRDLKTFLDFAERGPRASALRSAREHRTPTPTTSRWRSPKRCAPRLDRPYPDRRVEVPDRPRHRPSRRARALPAGVECDGATYHATATARDRDRIRQIVLEGLGWTLLRIWSTDFFLDREGALDRLHARIGAVLAAAREVSGHCGGCGAGSGAGGSGRRRRR